MSEDMSDEIRLGAAHLGGHQDPSHGIQALHGTSPLEQLIAMEEGGRLDRDQVRVEAMRRFLLYLFADKKPKDLRFATRRLYAVARGYYPQLLNGQTTAELAKIFKGPQSSGSTNFRESLSAVLAGDSFQERDETVARLMYFLFIDDKPSEPWFAMRRVYSLAKAFIPECLDGMSLETMGEVFGEAGEKSARARWSARIKVIVGKTIQDAGGVAHTKFSKSKSTCLKYAAAQQGNQNRRKKA
jgi:hypothetical protein